MIRLHMLRPLLDLIKAEKDAGASPEAIVDRLVNANGAKVHFANGTWSMKLAGLTVSATWGAPGLISNWQNRARRELEGTR